MVEDIRESGMYAGLPAVPLAEYMRTAATLRKLPELRRRLQALERKLDEFSG